MQPSGRACWLGSSEHQYTNLGRLTHMLSLPPAGDCILLGVRLSFGRLLSELAFRYLLAFSSQQLFIRTKANTFTANSPSEFHSPACYSIKRTSSFYSLLATNRTSFSQFASPFHSGDAQLVYISVNIADYMAPRM